MTIGVASNYNDFSGLSRLKYQAQVKPEEAAHEVAQQFEAIFVGMMMQAMRDATPTDGLFNSDQMDAYRDMFDRQLALDLSANGGLGLARMIEQQIAGRESLQATSSQE